MEQSNIFLFGFLSLLLSGLVIRRISHRSTGFIWHTGLLYGFPFLPAMMVVFSSLLMTGIWWAQLNSFMMSGVLLFANSLLLFLTAWMLVEKRLTKTHLILNPVLPSRSIPLHQISDYYIQTIGLNSQITLIYFSDGKRRSARFSIPTRYLKIIDLTITPALSESDRLITNSILKKQ